MRGENKNALQFSCKKFGEILTESIYEYRLNNQNIDVTILNYGGIISSIELPDKQGVKRNVVACFDNLEQYLDDHPYFGAIIGRYANRIAGGKFTLYGSDYRLDVNDKDNHLHGGFQGFDKKIWKLKHIEETDSSIGISLSFYSADMEEGYPGNLSVVVTYTLTAANELIIHYTARTDRPTIINLTNHSYFNLSGFQEEKIYNHHLRIFADAYTVKSENNLPTGCVSSVDMFPPLNFTSSKAIGENILDLVSDMGYDYNYVINTNSGIIREAACLVHYPSGRCLRVLTNQPGMQLYTANGFDGSLYKGEVKYTQHCSVALETQDFPDSPNRENFPNTILLPGDLYDRTTIYQFSITDNFYHTNS